MNKDNKSDIIIIYYLMDDIRILFNMGNGEFSDQIMYRTDDIPSILKIIDINNDNMLDLIIGDQKKTLILF